MADEDKDTEARAKQIEFLRPFLKQFRGDGIKISAEPVWAERVEAILADLAPDVLEGIAHSIRRSSDNQLVDLEAFGQTYGLTPAEIKMIDSIVGGLSVREHGKAYDISINTARVHMQRVLEKTGSNRQTDLLRKVFGR